MARSRLVPHSVLKYEDRTQHGHQLSPSWKGLVRSGAKWGGGGVSYVVKYECDEPADEVRRASLSRARSLSLARAPSRALSLSLSLSLSLPPPHSLAARDLLLVCGGRENVSPCRKGGERGGELHRFKHRSRVNMAHLRQSRPDSGLVFQVKALGTFQVALLSLKSGVGNLAFRPG